MQFGTSFDSNSEMTSDAQMVLPTDPIKIEVDRDRGATCTSVSEIQSSGQNSSANKQETEIQNSVKNSSAVEPEIQSQCLSKELDVLSTALCKTCDGVETSQAQTKADLNSSTCSDLVPSGTSDAAKTVAKEKPFPPGSWQETSGLLLLEKAYNAYCVLTQQAWKEHKHGKALIHAHLAVKCLSKSFVLSSHFETQVIYVCIRVEIGWSKERYAS